MVRRLYPASRWIIRMSGGGVLWSYTRSALILGRQSQQQSPQSVGIRLRCELSVWIRAKTADRAILVSQLSSSPKTAISCVPARFPLVGIAAIVSLIRDRTYLQLRAVQATGGGWPTAGTVQSPFIRESSTQGYQARTVTVGTETDQISSDAPRALDAMANPERHGIYQASYVFWPTKRRTFADPAFGVVARTFILRPYAMASAAMHPVCALLFVVGLIRINRNKTAE
jgi:hypothetical protein